LKLLHSLVFRDSVYLWTSANSSWYILQCPPCAKNHLQSVVTKLAYISQTTTNLDAGREAGRQMFSVFLCLDIIWIPHSGTLLDGSNSCVVTHLCTVPSMLTTINKTILETTAPCTLQV
jgi:hypothetical protein